MRRRKFSSARVHALVAVSAFFAAVSLAGCSSNPPELVGIQARISVAPADNVAGRLETLSVFVSVRDQDGYGDLESFYVINDAEELFWKFTPETWLKREEGSDTWIGTSGIAPADGASIPRGRYRLALIDGSGERAERQFSVASPATDPPHFPTLSISGGEAVISSPHPQNTLLFLDGSGETIVGATVKPGITKLDALYGSPEWKNAAASVVVYSYDPAADTGWYSWPKKIE
ncbi:MAG: hypothetical protein NT080_13820 [Spirochaetes bacterium]|nr:hypothetical protein [Spirochaetota bacterium]